jgi:PIN domain nuclease of toxin-antitoxin system
VNVLIDTVVLFRVAAAPGSLSKATRAVLEDGAHTLFVSLVSAWELAIKSSLGKLPLPVPVDTFFSTTTRDLLARTLGLDLAAVARVAELPHHHGDPFDRLLIAQALVEDCAVLTTDARFARYGVSVLG